MSSAVVVCALCVATGAHADDWSVHEWNNAPPGSYSVQASQFRIDILQPGVYKFFATTGGATDPLAQIDTLTVSFPNGVTGAVTVSILRSPATGGGAGCTELGQMNLNTTGVTASTVAELRVAGDAATQGPITFGTLADGDKFNVSGDVVNAVSITSGLSGNVACQSLGDFTATTASGSPTITVTNSYAGSMTINGSSILGGLSLGGLSGSVACTPHVGLGGVKIHGNVSGTLDVIGSIGAGGLAIDGGIASTGSVTVHDSIGSTVEIGGELAGSLSTLGNIAGYVLHCAGGVSGTLTVSDAQDYVFTALQVDGAVTGLIHVLKPLSSDTNATHGYVRVLGALGAEDNPGEIWLEGGLGDATSKSYVSIDYDGYDLADPETRWHSGSTVRLVNDVLTAQDPSRRVYEISVCKGDLTADHTTDFADIDPFVSALYDGTGYITAFPGMAGSRVFHADVNGSGYADFADIDAFVVRLFSCSPYPEILEESNAQGDGLQMQSATTGLDAAYVASILDENIGWQNRAFLIAAIASLADHPPAGSHVDWDAVLNILAGQ